MSCRHNLYQKICSHNVMYHLCTHIWPPSICVCINERSRKCVRIPYILEYIQPWHQPEPNCFQGTSESLFFQFSKWPYIKETLLSCHSKGYGSRGLLPSSWRGKQHLSWDQENPSPHKECQQHTLPTLPKRTLCPPLTDPGDVECKAHGTTSLSFFIFSLISTIIKWDAELQPCSRCCSGISCWEENWASLFLPFYPLHV